ncbi:MAG: hypothetical protein ACYC9J_11615 [Sulfuricaulis sp.]
MHFTYRDPESGEETEFHFPKGRRFKVANDDFEKCLICGQISSYRGKLTDDETGINNGVAYIGNGSGFEWECGHCRAHHVETNAPILAECYTHVAPGVRAESCEV